MKSIFKHIITNILKWEAMVLLSRYKPQIIAVSGSVGKTSTKDAIYTALAPYTTVRKSEKSFNSEIGIPLTILDLPNGWNNPFKWMLILCKGFLYAFILCDYPKHLILEVGSDRPGDIEKLSKWLPVKIAVLTRLPEIPVHVEFFKNGHELNEEDKKIIKALKKDGIIIINTDDMEMVDIPTRYPINKILSYGIYHEADIKASDVKVTYSGDDDQKVPTGMQFSIKANGIELPLSVAGVLGNQHVYPLLSAVTVVSAMGFDITKAMSALVDHQCASGRMKIILGINLSTIIDDTYNSSPIAVEEALNVLEKIKTTGKKIIVLGDMFELGIYTEREHLRLGKIASDVVDTLVTIGLRAVDFINGAVEGGMDKDRTHSFSNQDEVVKYLKKHVSENDVVLVKGSQGMRLEKIVKELMLEPEKAKEVLVRQEPEWEVR